MQPQDGQNQGPLGTDFTLEAANAGGGDPMNAQTQYTSVLDNSRASADIGQIKMVQLSNGSGARDEAEVRLAQPLLIVALGGSGRQIATMAKAGFIERLGQVPSNVILLAFDSADDPISVREGRLGRVVSLERESEFFLLDRVPVAGIKRSRQRHPEIVGRIGEDLNRISRTSIHDGSAQERPQGLLVLMWNASRIARIIENAIRRLVARDVDLHARMDGSRGINVVLVGSACGGQNSGAMLDMAYVVREKLSALGDLGDSSRVLAMVVLPDAFAGVRGPNFGPNTYAFFRELDHLMQMGGFDATYPGNLHVSSLERPFDYVFILDGVDERGKAWSNHEAVCALGADTLALLTSSEVGMQEISNAVNELGILNDVSPDGFGTYLATTGQAVIRFPARRVARRLALRHAVQMIDHCLRMTDKPGKAAIRGAGTIRDRLGLTETGAPFSVRIEAPVSLEQANPLEQPALARTFVNNYLQRRVYGEAFAQVSDTAALLKHEVIEDLRGQAAELLAAGSLFRMRAWLGQASEILAEQLTATREEQERLADLVEGLDGAMRSASNAMDQTTGGFPVGRRVRVRGAVNSYLDVANKLAQTRWVLRIEELAAEVFRAAGDWIRRLSQQAGATEVRLKQARENLLTEEALLAGLATYRSEINLASPGMVDSLYTQYAGDPDTDLQRAMDIGDGLLSWGAIGVDRLARALADIAARNFDPLLEMTVEDVLSQQWDDRSAGQWISRLAGLAAGAWNLDRSMLPGGGAEHPSFLTIGVPDANKSIFANTGYTLVTTHDPERIVVLRTVYGASVDTLKAAGAWKRAYEFALERTPVHVLPAFKAKAG